MTAEIVLNRMYPPRPYATRSHILRTQIGMFRPIRMDHTNCLQVAIKSIQFTQVHWYRNHNPQPLAESAVRLKYLRVFDSRFRTAMTLMIAF
jgi:hypothetical protein